MQGPQVSVAGGHMGGDIMTTAARGAGNRSQGGFTLVEILVVVAILAILAAMAVFAVGSFTDTAHSSACSVELRTIRTAATAFKTRNGGTGATSIVDLHAAGFLDEPTSEGFYSFVNGVPSLDSCPN
jgi:prepilin-type N-terminal cleavage/methylation domain-containing protein